MAEDLFAYQLNHPPPQEPEPLYTIRAPSSSNKGKRSKKRHRHNGNSESQTENNENSREEPNNANNEKEIQENKTIQDEGESVQENETNEKNQTKTKRSIKEGNSTKNTLKRDETYNDNENYNEEENENDGPKDDLERYKEIALSGGDFYDIPTELLSPLMRSLYKERASYLSQGLVNEAEVVDNSIHICRELMTDQAKVDAMNYRQKKINERLISAQNELAALEETIERQERNMRIQLQKQVITLESRQQEEIDKVTRDWESPEKAKRYNRSSAQLRQLRAQSVKLLNAHRYDEMKVVDRMADKLQADEVEAQRRQWEDDFNSVLRKLLGKHHMEKEKLQMAHNVQIGEYEAAKRFDLSVINKRIQNLERELAEAGDSEKVWNLYHRNDIVVNTKKCAESGKKSVKPSEFSKLNLPPLEDVKTSRMPPAATLAMRTFKHNPRTPRLTQ